MSEEEYKEFAAKAPKHVVKWVWKLPGIGVYDYFISPRTGNDPSRCPWLKKIDGLYACSIYDCRPPICRNFPLDVEQIKTAGCGCRGLDHLQDEKEQPC